MKPQSSMVLEMVLKKHRYLIITKKTKSPYIGSGNIPRRVVLEITFSSPRRKGKRVNLTDFDDMRPTNRVKRLKGDQKVSFGNAKNKIIFLKWLSLGPPFVKHKVMPGKTLDFSLRAIARACKRHEVRVVTASMEACHTLFRSNTFKYRYSKQIRRLTCHDFFSGYNRDDKERLKGTLEIKSWFHESLKGSEYLKQKYDIINVIKHKALYDILKGGWEEHSRSVITKKETEDLISCSNKVHSFAESNKKEDYARDIASAIINWLKNDKPNVTTAYLKTDAFWQKKVPRLLIESGILNEWERVRW